jgi:hypothetical protein
MSKELLFWIIYILGIPVGYLMFKISYWKSKNDLWNEKKPWTIADQKLAIFAAIGLSWANIGFLFSHFLTQWSDKNGNKPAKW